MLTGPTVLRSAQPPSLAVFPRASVTTFILDILTPRALHAHIASNQYQPVPSTHYYQPSPRPSFLNVPPVHDLAACFTIYHSQQTWADAILYRPRIGIKRTNSGPEYIARKIGRRVTRMYLPGRLPRDLGVEAPQTSKTSENLVRRKPSDNDGNIVFSVSHSTFSSLSVAAQLLIVALSQS